MKMAAYEKQDLLARYKMTWLGWHCLPDFSNSPVKLVYVLRYVVTRCLTLPFSIFQNLKSVNRKRKYFVDIDKVLMNNRYIYTRSDYIF